MPSTQRQAPRRRAPARVPAGGRRSRAEQAKGGDGAARLPSVANHPRAPSQVKQAKAAAGLAAFALVALLSWRAGLPATVVLLRSLAGGVAAYLIVWACAVAIWRQLVVTELRVAREQRAEQQQAARDAAAQASGTDGEPR